VCTSRADTVSSDRGAFHCRREEADEVHADVVMTLEDVFECISSETGSIWTKRDFMDGG